MDVIEIKNNNFIKTYIKSDIENIISFNENQFKIYITQQESRLIIDSDYLFINNENKNEDDIDTNIDFVKLELNFI